MFVHDTLWEAGGRNRECGCGGGGFSSQAVPGVSQRFPVQSEAHWGEGFVHVLNVYLLLLLVDLDSALELAERGNNLVPFIAHQHTAVGKKIQEQVSSKPLTACTVYIHNALDIVSTIYGQ